MLINTGQRTDIPAFYSEWFINRIKDGYVYVRNPYFPKRVNKYILDPEVVDGICFCSKNPKPLLKYFDIIKDFRQLWYVTITPYGKDIEPYVLDAFEVIDTFKELSLLNHKKVIWRYDPIFINDKYNKEFHLKAFYYICKSLSGYCHQCVVSFIDLYDKCKRNFPGIKEVSKADQHYLISRMVKIADKYNMKLYLCAEDKELECYGAIASGCMSKEVIEDVLGIELDLKSGSARKECNCLLGNDIGAYDTCLHGCLYCYANVNKKQVYDNYKLHDLDSPLLIGHIEDDDIIVDIKQQSSINKQISFDI